MSPALAAFETQVLKRQLRHGSHWLLPWARANVALDADTPTHKVGRWH
jgi:hypothetical protein